MSGAAASASDEGDFASEVWHAADERSEALVWQLVADGAQFTPREWTEMVADFNCAMLRAALEAGFQPTTEAMCSALEEAARFDQMGLTRPDDGLQLCRILTAGCDQIGAAYAQEVARQSADAVYEGALYTCQVTQGTPVAECHELVRFLYDWFTGHGANPTNSAEA